MAACLRSIFSLIGLRWVDGWLFHPQRTVEAEGEEEGGGAEAAADEADDEAEGEGDAEVDGAIDAYLDHQRRVLASAHRALDALEAGGAKRRRTTVDG